MKKYYYAIFLLSIFTCYSQDNNIYSMAETRPQPNEDIVTVGKKIAQNIPCLKTGINYFFNFIVEKDGSLSNVTLLRGELDTTIENCNESIQTAFANSPKWIPGKNGNIPVRVQSMIPLKKEIENNVEKDTKNNITYTNGDKYIGEISNYQRNGQGTYYFSNGDRYEGIWKDNKKSGNGKYYYVNGDVNEGVWENDVAVKFNYISKGEIIADEKTQFENQTKKNQNPELPNIYNVEYFRHNGEAKLNVKSFRNCVASSNSILSLVYAPPSGNTNNQQFSTIGSFSLKTDLATNTTTDIIKDANPGYDSNKTNLNTYNLNNNLDELNKIYYISRGKQIEITEYTFGGDNMSSKDNSYALPYEFELNTADGSKETFELNNASIGNGICGFMAKSTFDKKTYIFIYDYKNKSKYTKIDVTKISNNLKTYSDPDNSTHINFNGDKNGIPFKTSFNNVSAIVQNEKYIYVFISGWNFSEETVLPIKINKSNFSATVMTKSLLTRSNFRKQEFTDKSVSEDGYFYMPSSKGFLNYYKVLKNNNYVYKLDYYNSEFNKVWESTIDDIIINHAYESGDFIILGGYSKTSGYKGYPNPKVVVINRKTNSISYKKVIAKKNGEVSLINSDSNGNIIIAIGSYCCQAYDTDSEFVPQIIIDKLDSKGFFQNELFNK